MDMSKNKNMNKATRTLMNGCHTCVKHRGALLETEKVEPKKKKKNLTKFYKIFLWNWENKLDKIIRLILYVQGKIL